MGDILCKHVRYTPMLCSHVLTSTISCTLQIQDNFCYNHMGHGYFLEDGGEKYNIFDGNLAMSTRKGTGDLEPHDSL